MYECIGGVGGHPGAQYEGPPDACGNSTLKRGYACSTVNLIGSWRKQWSARSGSTSPMVPFGLVSLHAGGSEGHPYNMANFRHAQTAGYGFLPGPVGSPMEKTFVAQAYDAGDPGDRIDPFGPASQADAPYQSAYDFPTQGRKGYSNGGHQSFTPQYMGGLHPRSKQIIGRRLALAARAVAYGESDVPFTGPVLKSCKIHPTNTMCPPGGVQVGNEVRPCTPNGQWNSRIIQRQITLSYDEQLLGEDAVRVWPTTPDTEGLASLAMFNCINGTCLSSCGSNVTCVNRCARINSATCMNGWASTPVGPAGNGFNPTQYQNNHFDFATARVISPLEVQFNHTLWMPASISFNSGNSQGFQYHRPGDKCWGQPCKNSKVDGWSNVIATAPTALPVGCQMQCPTPEQLAATGQWCENCTHTLEITGVRYAWSESPCCGGQLASQNVIPCPVNSCPISTVNSTLPAVPFTAKIRYTNDSLYTNEGSCECFAPQKCSE